MRKYRKPYKEKTKVQFTVKLISDIIIAACLAYFLVTSYAGRYTVVGNSMNDELMHDDILLIDKAIYNLKQPERFDVVVFRAEGVNNDKLYVKRIIGLPGETIRITNGQIFVNSMVLVNDISDSEILTPGLASEPIVLGDNEYFVLGDNRNNSEDSRFYTIGNVKFENIVGRPWLKVYPFSDFGFVE